ncbi:hydrolase [Amphibacillus sp. MSJ-3]|uniref:GDSL-type esterase/lipase family protein n=1 Tax=Amphibacillus sp. MSJ-3 TaxID=2841505 RepID=UPI001C0EC386|nr:GDSL-type esterase/lipase family protein [Amphibacillus sp. MSJ-3]MBU5593911.1 hydrolase [Amphibacillus sp. MSJ-3]
MSRRRKKMFLGFALSAFIIGVFLFLIFRPNRINLTTTTEPEQEPIDEVIDQVENMDEEVQSTTNDLSQNLKEAVDQTISVFVQNDYHISAIGDSLTQGVGDEINSDGYLTTLKRRLTDMDYRVRIENFGKRGNRTDQLIERIEEESAIQRSIRRADIVLLTAGANDIMQIVRENILNLDEDIFDLELDHYEERLIDLYELINSYNEDAEIYLIGFYNPFESYFNDIEALEDILIKWNETGETVFESYPNGHFIPIHDLFQINQINLLADDNFHPNETGYSLMGARVLNSIEPMLENLAAEQDIDNDDEGISME